MLCHLRTRRGCNNRTRGRDIEATRCIAASSTGVDQVFCIDCDAGRQLAHHRGSGADFLDAFTFHAQTNQKSADLGRSAFTGHNLLHDIGHILLAKVLTGNYGFNRCLNIHHIPIFKKLRNRSCPCSVNIDSG